MKKQPTGSLALAVVFSAFVSFGAESSRLLARLPAVDKLPATCELVLHVDFQRLLGVPFIAKARASAPDPTLLASRPSGAFGGWGAPFDAKFIDDIQEVLFFQLSRPSGQEKESPLSGAYLRGTFRREEFLKAFGKEPAGKVEGLDLYRVEPRSQDGKSAPSHFAFLAENTMIIGTGPFVSKALEALHGKSASLPPTSPIVRLFQNDRSYLLGLAKSEAISVSTEGMAGQVSAFGLGDEPPSVYLLSLAPISGKADAIRSSLDLVFKSEQAMIQARDGLNGLLALLAMTAQENPPLQALQKRLKVTGLHKRVRIALEIDEQLLALATEQLKTVSVENAIEEPAVEGIGVPAEGAPHPVEKTAPATKAPEGARP